MNKLRNAIRSALVLTLIATVLGISIGFGTEQRELRRYPIPHHGVLELNVPTSWRDDVHKSQENLPPTIVFKPSNGNDFEALISVSYDNAGNPGFNSPEAVRTLIEKDSQKILPKAVETKIVLKEIRGPDNIGYFYSLTDKAPKPGEFLYATRGGMITGNLLLTVTILHRVKESESLKEVLLMIRQARQIPK